MKTETSFNKKVSISLSKKSDFDNSSIKNKNTFKNISTINRFAKKITLNQSKFATASKDMSLTDEMLKFRTKSFNFKEEAPDKNTAVKLNRELEDPDNRKIEQELQKLVGVSCDITLLEDNFENLVKYKSEDTQMVTEANNDEKDLKIKYNYANPLTGLQSVIESFYDKMDEEQKFHKLKAVTKKTSHLIMETTISSEKKHDLSSLENIYNLIGHEIYTKLIKIFEKYCNFGKSNSNFNMDYSQFLGFINENNVTSPIITKIQSEMIFNRSKSGSKCNFFIKKAINFEEFINILLEFSKLIYDWEKKPLNCFRYFINKFLLNIPCLAKTDDEIIFDRCYFLFEHGDLYKEVNKHLPFLYKNFQKYKVKDLRLGERIDNLNFINFAKDFTIIPCYLSAKEAINTVNYSRYKKKSLLPNNLFDFCSFVEIICLMSFQSFEKFNQESKDGKQLLVPKEKIKLFLNFLRQK